MCTAIIVILCKVFSVISVTYSVISVINHPFHYISRYFIGINKLSLKFFGNEKTRISKTILNSKNIIGEYKSDFETYYKPVVTKTMWQR